MRDIVQLVSNHNMNNYKLLMVITSSQKYSLVLIN